MPKRVPFDRSTRLRIIVALTVFIYLTILRTRHISETFWLLGDQMLYWRMALGAWSDLPYGGGPSSVGGTTIGPAFVWTMWIIRNVVGPWTENLPHAGGIGLSIIQSGADAFLLVAIWKRFGSPVLALAVTLLVASSPYDMALTATIWNPPLAAAFIKLAISFVLLGDRDASLWYGAGATAMALLAVQTHSSAVFFAAPVIASLTARELLAHQRHRALRCALVSAAVVLVLETPFLLDLAMRPGKRTSPSRVVENVSYTFEHPELLRPAAAFQAVADASQFILLRPWMFAWFGALLAACSALTTFRTRDDVTLLSVTVVPLVCAGVGFSFWQGPIEHYWFLTMAPCAALIIGLALTAWRPAASIVATALALLVVAAQPARFEDAMTIHRLPEYRPLVEGSQTIRRRLSEVRRIETEFDLPPSTDPYFIYEEVLGGRVTPTAPYAATIEKTGGVRFTLLAE